ncbi:uncharacterized protein L203_103522 [Cryptococcus depauperatus CBS 7841]|uniref:Vps72/YL1 C-terminal domain-containing protein n=1 Tax=Cryptococcus depauperatus CBS 7841 TaxID=1295531 RepID=A0AAJ8JU06_9TREE
MEMFLISVVTPSKPLGKSISRKSNTSTPAPSEDGNSIPIAAIIERLSYADTPRPFKSPGFQSCLPSRTATTSTTTVKKNVKQILALERERLSGGDGFLSAAHVGMKKRGETIVLGKKKKGAAKKNNIQNLLKGKMKREAEDEGTETPTGDSEAPSGTVTPSQQQEEDEELDLEAADKLYSQGESQDEQKSQKEIITYMTPAAPPSLLPAKKYCDITGLYAKYTDPKTKLRYKGLEVWHVVRSLGPGADQSYLALRNAQTSLK